jgi:hypothetical protein
MPGASKSVRSDLSRTVQPGDKRVKVVIIDTGVDGSYPDIAPDFDKANSRNFTRDIPTDVTGAVVIASRRGMTPYLVGFRRYGSSWLRCLGTCCHRVASPDKIRPEVL